jgi:hypothetical protein
VLTRPFVDKVGAALGCAAVVMFLGLAKPAEAHDPKHHTENPVLADAKNQTGGLCCDGKDYTIADAWERLPNGKYRVLLDNQWLDVPDEAHVANVKNPYTEAIVWLFRYSDGVGNRYMGVRCFKEGVAI